MVRVRLAGLSYYAEAEGRCTSHAWILIDTQKHGGERVNVHI